jgi:hypothetical protein
MCRCLWEGVETLDPPQSDDRLHEADSFSFRSPLPPCRHLRLHNDDHDGCHGVNREFPDQPHTISKLAQQIQ